jgi:glutathione S-transferase
MMICVTDPTNFLGAVLFRGLRKPDMKTQVDRVMKELEFWEGYLTEDDYLAGDTMTMVDLVVFPFLAPMVEILKLPLHRKFPSLARWYDDIKMRQSCQDCDEFWKSTEELAKRPEVNVLEDIE